MAVDKNLTATRSLVSAAARGQILGQRGAVLWFTGLSGSGKSTIAYALEKRLVDMGRLAYTLDGDNLRLGLCSDLGFGAQDRQENIRRVSELATLFCQSGMFVLTSFISPYRADRDAARAKLGASFVEIYLDVSIEDCAARDPKGLYKKAMAGEIKDFTGISAPYEAPTEPELRVNTAKHSIEECVDMIVGYLEGKRFFTRAASKGQQEV